MALFWISTKISTGTYNSSTATFSMTKVLQCPRGFLIYYLKENTSHTQCKKTITQKKFNQNPPQTYNSR
jgi:hypothetical protein